LDRSAAAVWVESSGSKVSWVLGIDNVDFIEGCMEDIVNWCSRNMAPRVLLQI
jgi:hypothetical protein